MLRTLLYALAILHLGPGFAFAVVAFGCDGITPALGKMCGDNVFSSFGLITAAAWLTMILGLAVMRTVKRAR